MTKFFLVTAAGQAGELGQPTSILSLLQSLVDPDFGAYTLRRWSFEKDGTDQRFRERWTQEAESRLDELIAAAVAVALLPDPEGLYWRIVRNAAIVAPADPRWAAVVAAKLDIAVQAKEGSAPALTALCDIPMRELLALPKDRWSMPASTALDKLPRNLFTDFPGFAKSGALELIELKRSGGACSDFSLIKLVEAVGNLARGSGDSKVLDWIEKEFCVESSGDSIGTFTPLPKVAMEAVYAVAPDTPRGMAMVLRPLDDSRYWNSQMRGVAQALAKWGDQIVPDLRERLGHPRYGGTYIRALGEIGAPAHAAFDDLLSLLNGPSPTADLVEAVMRTGAHPSHAATFDARAKQPLLDVYFRPRHSNFEWDKPAALIAERWLDDVRAAVAGDDVRAPAALYALAASANTTVALADALRVLDAEQPAVVGKLLADTHNDDELKRLIDCLPEQISDEAFTGLCGKHKPHWVKLIGWAGGNPTRIPELHRVMVYQGYPTRFAVLARLFALLPDSGRERIVDEVAALFNQKAPPVGDLAMHHQLLDKLIDLNYPGLLQRCALLFSGRIVQRLFSIEPNEDRGLLAKMITKIGITTWQLVLDALRQPGNLKAGEIAAVERNRATAVSYLTPLSPLAKILVMARIEDPAMQTSLTMLLGVQG